MRLYIPLAFLSGCVWSIADQSPTNIPFVIKEPMGPKSNGPLHLEKFKNMDHNEKDVQFNLEWEYEASTVKNDIRSINKKQIDKYASLRFVLKLTIMMDGLSLGKFMR